MEKKSIIICREIRKVVKAMVKVQKILDEIGEEKFDKHIEECETCNAEIEKIKKMIN